MKGKAALPLLENLRKIDSSVRWEEPFDWLFVPKSTERMDEEQQILEALQNDCRMNRSRFENQKKNADWQDIYHHDEKIRGISRKLEFDFFLPRLNLAIEFDEVQHFTAERNLTFKYYPSGGFSFDVSRWSQLCAALARTDPNPPARDWQRAFRDSVRDLRSRKHGLPLIRLYCRDFDEAAFKRTGTFGDLEQIVRSA